MSANFKTPDRDQLYLLPVSLEEWIPEDDIVNFVIEAAELVPLDDFRINHNGSGSAQYHPQMMLALLLYCYCHGIFSSRKIERATFLNVAVRYICGNTHPDYSTICLFRTRNEKAIKTAFLNVLKLAKELGILKIGVVSTDGTKLKANASIHRSLRKDRAEELDKILTEEIDELLKKAEEADDEHDKDDNDKLQKEINRRDKLRKKLRDAQKKLKEQDRQEDKDQINLTDEDSRIMKKNTRSSYTQSYNAQAVVDAESTMLILGGGNSLTGNPY